jgi:probable HAF family extracellular repeat protein
MPHVRGAVVASLIVSVTGLTVCSASLAANLPSVYVVTDIGTLPGGSASKALGINSAGDVVGMATDPNDGFNNHAVLYTGGTMINLGLGNVQGAIWSEARAINPDGLIVGDTQNGAPHAFLYEANQFYNLETMRDTFWSQPWAIDSTGQIVGTVGVLLNPSTPVYHAFLSDGQTMTDLTAELGNPDYSEAFGINDLGQIVGLRRIDGVHIHAFRLDSNGPVDLGTLGGQNSSAQAINNAGQIVGYSYLAGNGATTHPFLYTDGQLLDLGLLPDATNGYASAINSDGIVVGHVQFPGYSDNTRAFVYADGGLHDLNDLLVPGSGWVLKAANGINDQGEIAGWGTLNGATRGFVLRPSSMGDMNCDGTVDFGDINPFVLALTDPAGYQAAFPDCNPLIGDMNGSGFVDFPDINLFVAKLTNP